MSQHASPKSTSLYSWPPSPALLRFHLLIRSILLLTDTIGLSLLFAVGVEANNAAAIVAASFLAGSLFVTPFIMIWNRILLKRVTKTNTSGQYQQLDDDENPLPRFRVGGLKIFTFLEGFGAVAFLVMYPSLMAASEKDTWYWYSSDRHYYMTFSYGSVSVLISILFHTFLFTTQCLQLRSATRIRTSKKLFCPHCNHTMTRVSSSPSSSSCGAFETAPETIFVEIQGETDADMLWESLVDARESVSMVAGQETGTTFKTPRVSESADGAGSDAMANEVGEGEGDALISKAG